MSEILRTVHEDGRIDVAIGLPTAAVGVRANSTGTVDGTPDQFVCPLCLRRLEWPAFVAHSRPCVLAHPEAIEALTRSELDRGREDLARYIDKDGLWRP